MWTNVIMSLNYQWDELLLLGRSMSKLCFGGKKRYLVFRRSTAIFIISATEAIVRLAPNNSDVYMGHNTWTGFYSMLRLLKDWKHLKTNGKLIHQCHLCGMKGEIVLPFHCCFVRNMIFLWVAVQIVLSRVDFWQHFDKFKTFQRSETLSQPWNFMQLLTPKTS